MTQVFGESKISKHNTIITSKSERLTLEHEFFVTARGPPCKLNVFDDVMEGGFHVARSVNRRYLSDIYDHGVIYWVSDRLKKDPFSLKYQLKELIDEGTYAKVYRCVANDSTASEYAVKVMNKQQMKALGLGPYLKREVEILRKIKDNSSICCFIDFIETHTHYYLVMELLKGGSLEREYDAYDERQVKLYAYQIANALKYIHNNGIFHADLQLGNICKVSKDEANHKIKLVDFGLSDFCANGKKHCRCVGNLYYAAPEMLQGKHYHGPEIDIWAFGVCLFKMATGYKPFRDAACIISGTFMVPLEDEEDLSDACCDLIKQILQVDSSKRPTIDEILQHPFFDTCRTHVI